MRVIVPDKTGLTVLNRDIPNLKVTLVRPEDPIPASDLTAEILVVGPAERSSEVKAALAQIRQLPHLKLLQTLGQGTEQWDGKLPEGIELRTARGAHGGSTAEWAVMSLLALTRELPYFMENQHRHSWQDRRSVTLLNSRVLVYGAGDLGENIRKRLEPFGAKISVVAAHARSGVIDTDTARGLLPEADAVILALPLIPATEGIANEAFLSSLPDGAVVVNAGRGGLVDQPALLKQLQAGRLRAALDVMTPEPLPADNPLWNAPNTIITPHTAGNTEGADQRAWQVASQQIREYLEDDRDQT